MRKHNIHIAACALAVSLLTCGAQAQTRPDYPKRPVRFIVAQTPGGNGDFVGRTVASDAVIATKGRAS